MPLDYFVFSKSHFCFLLRLLTFPHANKSVIAYGQRIKNSSLLYFHMWLLTSTLFGILLRFCEIRKKKFYIHLHPLYLLNSLKKKKLA